MGVDWRRKGTHGGRRFARKPSRRAISLPHQSALTQTIQYHIITNKQAAAVGGRGMAEWEEPEDASR